LRNNSLEMQSTPYAMKTTHKSQNPEKSKAAAHNSGGGVALAAPLAAQMKRVGYVPSAPGTFRGTTTLAYNGTGVPHGGKDFNGTQTDAVRTNNNAGVGSTLLTVNSTAAHNKSDIGGAALMNRDHVSQVTPEVDHIVPKAEGGANDYHNARVLSKTQNTGGGGLMARPNAGQKTLRAYEDITIGPTNGMASIISAGDAIDANDSDNLATYSGVMAAGNPGAYIGANITAMIAAGNGTANGIDIS
jgi:hypothetical protein